MHHDAQIADRERGTAKRDDDRIVVHVDSPRPWVDLARGTLRGGSPTPISRNWLTPTSAARNRTTRRGKRRF